MRRTGAWVSAAVAVLALAGPADAASTTHTHGYDVSWPQCTRHGTGTTIRSMPGSSSARYIILGLTHGAGHTVNPCLPAQLAWAKSHRVPVGAYLVPTYPTSAELRAASSGPYGACAASDTRCRLGNDGARQAADAVATMREDGVPAPMVWVDVETRHVHPWTSNRSANAQVVQGVFAGLRAAHVAYGIYTTSYMWQHIVGGLRVNVPNWLPSGGDSASGAAAMCRHSVTGGAVWLGQYTHTFDQDVTCPVMDATPGHYGPLYRYRHAQLQMGSSGRAVLLAQRVLGTPAAASGTYDHRTYVAVLAFQARHSLPVTGRIDNDDWRALGAYHRYGAHRFWLYRVAAPVS
jgi:hypothetical protein